MATSNKELISRTLANRMLMCIEECEAIQPIEKAEQEKQETGLLPDTNLFPYFLNPL